MQANGPAFRVVDFGLLGRPVLKGFRNLQKHIDLAAAIDIDSPP